MVFTPSAPEVDGTIGLLDLHTKTVAVVLKTTTYGKAIGGSGPRPAKPWARAPELGGTLQETRNSGTVVLTGDQKKKFRSSRFSWRDLFAGILNMGRNVKGEELVD